MTDEFKKEDLKQGFEFQKVHIEELIRKAEENYMSSDYVHSIPDSIIALEEITKLRSLRDAYHGVRKLSLDDWKKLTQYRGAHNRKLTLPYEQVNERLKAMDKDRKEALDEFVERSTVDAGGNKSEKIEDVEYDIDSIKALNDLKQACMYIDYKDGKWYSAKLILSKNELKSLAYVILNHAKYVLNMTLLHFEIPEVETDPTSKSYQEYVQHPRHKKHVEFNENAKKNSYQKKALLAKSALNKFKNS